MAIRVALHHKTSYHYDRLVSLSPHEVRLRPAPHARTPILSYSLTVAPQEHFINWQQDPYGNYIGRFVFPEKSGTLEFTVDLVADMTVINPFDFFVEQYAEQFPFAYPAQLGAELGAYLQSEAPGPLLSKWLAAARQELLASAQPINNFLVALNQRLQGDIAYLLRMEPGVQTPEETLQKGSGSCRDSAWLLVQILREFGLAARFVSGYLIQLTADQQALDGPSGTAVDFTDLHAWTEVYIPGAGWIGLDPTSGMLASEGHIPLACTAQPSSAAPVTGFTDKAEVSFEHRMTITRIHEDPRVTKPYSEEDWQQIDRLGQQVDADLKRQDVRLTQGGEPTFVSIDDMDGAQWNTEAHGTEKRVLAGELLQRLKNHFAPGGMLHYGQGKWYPGEPLPRWALNMFWRVDGQPMWLDATLFSADEDDDGYGAAEAQGFSAELVRTLGLPANSPIAAYEDVLQQAQLEQNLPANLDPLQLDLKAPEARQRLARLLEQGLGAVVGYVLPLATQPLDPSIALGVAWRTCPWPLKRGRLYLTEGDSPLGLRLPLNALPWVMPEEMPAVFDVDPFAPREPLAAAASAPLKAEKRPILKRKTAAAAVEKPLAPAEVIHTALCVEVRGGRLHVFMPPLHRIEDYLALVRAIEHSATKLKLKLRIEGYQPPRDPRIKLLSVTPDPGVIEVNIHPAASWNELVYTVSTLYEEARLTRLGTEKFMHDGRHTGTGGGNHATLGGATAEDSPLLRRPDLLKSLITYWQNHPALS
ncbi:MAG: transglutaminase family protein, partial [Pseudomonas sp.]|uniref:transglutaminase family protein n=1 Tax=Pseudomonas sp. TaxID=306 RepID=UPI003BB7380B